MGSGYGVRQVGPLVHCITNTVVANFTANGLLAVGASPIMADAPEEAAAITGIANALLVNIGTLHARTVEAMKLSVQAANTAGIPVVLDPVGAGASPYRLHTTQALLNYRISCIRCNAGELAAIAGVDWAAKGVDAGSGTADVVTLAKQVAHRYQTLVAVTGARDIVTDGTRVIKIYGGSERLTQITGAGCLLSAIVAAFLAVERSIEAVACAMQFYKRCGEQTQTATFGDISASLLTALHTLSQKGAMSYESSFNHCRF